MKPPRRHGGGKPLRDLTGRTFGRLTVIERAPRPIGLRIEDTAAYWRVRCSGSTRYACRGETVVRGASLGKPGSPVSCGCWRREQCGGLAAVRGARGAVS